MLDYERQLHHSIQAFALPLPHQYQDWLNAYLDERDDEGRIERPPHGNVRVKKEKSNDLVFLTIGDQRPNAEIGEVLTLRGGARLTFGLTLKPEQLASKLLTAYFNLQLAPAQGNSNFRIELEDHSEALRAGNLDATHPFKSALHLHVNDCAAHLPFPPMEPRAILDHIFFEILPFA